MSASDGWHLRHRDALELLGRLLVARRSVPEVPAWVCPHCGRASWNPHDGEHRYCGACHHFCDDVPQALS